MWYTVKKEKFYMKNVRINNIEKKNEGIKILCGVLYI